MPSRTRSRQQPTVSVPVIADFDYGGADSSVGSFVQSSGHESITDVVTENYYSRVRNGEIIMNPCSYTYNSILSEGSGSGKFKNGAAWSYSLSGPLTAFRLSQNIISDLYPSDNVSIEALVRDAKFESLAQINKPALETGEDMLELRETINYLSNPLKGILKNVERFRREYKRRHRNDRKKQILTVADALSSSWLEYRMAFSPLVRSVHGILTEISNKTSTPPKIRRAHGRREASGNWSKTRNYSSGYDNYIFQTTLQRSVQVHTTVVYKIQNASYGNAWRYGLRARDFPKSFWAVVPLSFMVDRVANVSKMISGLTNLADPSVIILGASTTTRNLTTRSVQMTSHTNPYGSASGETIREESFSFGRDLWSPSVSDTIPSVKKVGLIDSQEKIGDLVALIFTALRSKI